MSHLSNGTIQALGIAFTAVLTANIIFFIIWAYGVLGANAAWEAIHLPPAICLLFSTVLAIIGIVILTSSNVNEEAELIKVRNSRRVFGVSSFSLTAAVVVAQFV